MLARIRKAMEEREEGFTLIELLVVIIIIGILAAIAIPIFLNQRKKAQNSAVKSDLRTVANEMETYFTDQQVYTNDKTKLNPISYSNGVKVSAATTTTGYCLEGWNANSDVTGAGGNGKFYWYDSQAGGLQGGASATAPAGGACADATLSAFVALN
jgi:type IV pilus assembly protein PilA